MFRSLLFQSISHAGYFTNGRLAAYVVFVSVTLTGGLIAADQVVKLIGWLEVLQMLNGAFVVYFWVLMESRISLKRIQVNNIYIYKVSSWLNLEFKISCIIILYYYIYNFRLF